MPLHFAVVWTARSKRSCRRAAHRQFPRASIARDDSRCGTDPCPVSPATPRPTVARVRAKAGGAAGSGPPGCGANEWLTSFRLKTIYLRIMIGQYVVAVKQLKRLSVEAAARSIIFDSATL